MQRQQRGFTLVEVLVAMAIVAVAIPALISTISTQANNVSKIREQTIADWVAQNQLNAQRLNYRLTGRILNGRQSGSEEMSGIEWHWLVESKETSVDRLRRLTVKVGLDQGDVDSNPISQLSGFLYEPEN